MTEATVSRQEGLLYVREWLSAISRGPDFMVELGLWLLQVLTQQKKVDKRSLILISAFSYWIVSKRANDK